jgi:hypothetical protein
MIPPHIVGIWRVQKRFPHYGIPIWSLWPNIRFLPSIVAEKNILDGRKDRQTEVKQYTPLRWSGDIIIYFEERWIFFILTRVQHAHKFFHLGVHVPFYLHFWGYIQIFGSAMYPLTLHWGYKENELHFSHFTCPVFVYVAFFKHMK